MHTSPGGNDVTLSPAVALSRRPSLRSDADRDAIVKANVGLVFGTLKRMGLTTHRCVDDLVQAGLMGLLRAAELFDEGRECTLSTFADYWIRREVLTELRRLLAVRRYRCIDRRGGLADVLCDLRGEQERERTEADEGRAVAIERALTFLDGRSADVVRMRYFVGLTLDEVAGRVGVGKERVRQIEAKALRRLRQRCGWLADLLAD